MTDEELDRIEQVLNEATPGPWKCWKKPTELDPSVVIATDVFIFRTLGGNDEANAEFIIEAREAVPKLIAEIKRLRKEEKT